MRVVVIFILIIFPFCLFGLNGLSYNSYNLLMHDNGFFNNPAGLNIIEKQAVSFLFNNVGENFYNLNLAYGRRFGKIILGSHLSYKTSKKYDMLDASGNKTGSFKYNYIGADIMFASTGYFLGDLFEELNYGIKIKFENEQADEYSDIGYMADIGLIYGLAFFKSKYIDRLSLFVSFENLGKSFGDINRMRLLSGILIHVPLVKNLRQLLIGVSTVQYFDSQLKENNGLVFSLGYREDLSLLSSSLRDYVLIISISYNYIQSVRILGDFSGLEYGMNIDSKYFNFGYSCLFNSLSGNNYYTSLSIKF